MNIGVLAIQGDYDKHLQALQRLQIETAAVRTEAELAACDGLIIPGGESTTLTIVMQKHGLWQPLMEFGRHKAIFGTCAGCIVLAREVSNHALPTLGLIDITVSRNAYGRQVDSFIDNIVLHLNGRPQIMPGFFIRAPKIARVGAEVDILGRHGEEIVMAESRHILVCTFHPELTEASLIHTYFAAKVKTVKSDSMK